MRIIWSGLDQVGGYKLLDKDMVSLPQAIEAIGEVGEILVYSDCGVDLEVTSLDPAAVQLAPMEQEDWGE